MERPRARLAGHRLVTGDALLAEAIHRDACACSEHAFDVAHFTLLLTGEFEEVAGSWTRTMRPLSTTFSPPGLAHRDRIGRSGARLFTVWLRRSLADEYLLRADVWHAPQQWESAAVALPLLRLYTELVNTPESLDSFVIEDRLALLIETLQSPHPVRETKRPRWVDGARERISDSREASLRILDLARDAGVHPVHFSRTFRQFVGVRPAEYRTRSRVAAGCRLVASTSLPLSQVALAAGFADQSHMTRAFSRVLGLGPAAYRALLGD